MNTTMAPMDHDQDGLAQRRDPLYKLSLRETASASGDNNGNNKGHGKGFGFFNRNKDKGNNNDSGGSGSGGGSNKDSNGGGIPAGAVPSFVSSFIPSILEAPATSTSSTVSTTESLATSTSTSIGTSTSTSLTTSTTESSTVSLLTALTPEPTPSNNVISTLFPMTTADSSTAIPTMFPFTSSLAVPTALPAIVPSSSDTAAGTSSSSASISSTETGSSSTKSKPPFFTGTKTGDKPFGTDHPPFFPEFRRPQPNGLSLTGEHILIGFGAIGAFIMVCAAAYFCARMRNKDLFVCLRNRKFGKGGRRGWYGWRKAATNEDYTTEPPPKYAGEEYLSDQKEPVAEATYFSQDVLTVAPPISAYYSTRKDSLRLDTSREGLLDNSAPLGMSSTELAQKSATETFYGITTRASPLARNPITSTTSNSPSPQDILLTRQLSSNYTNGGTYLTRQTSDAFDPNQREVNHLSYLSSLSSGFGDGLIIPEPTVVAGNGIRQTYRASQPIGAPRFSWQRSIALERTNSKRDRDTVYTTVSTESAPRFRSVNSWVAQQSNRVERQVQSDRELPSMPAVPPALQAGIAHGRNNSDDQAFKHHPGEEVDIKSGSRIASTVLDDTITVIRNT